MKKSKLYIAVRPILTVLFKTLYKPTIKGVENIPTSGGVVLAGNHTNNLDCIMLIASTKREIHFLAKKELWSGPKKIIFANMGLIPVDRKRKDRNALYSAIKALESEDVIGIFPEGTFNRSEDTILPFKIGAVKMAQTANKPIVPFIIKGEYKMFKKTISLEFLEPIYVGDDLKSENEKLMNIVKDKLEG